MSCQVLVSNLAGNKGDVVSIVAANHIWTHNESLAAWLQKYPNRSISEYHRNFSLLVVTDQSINDINFILDTPINRVDEKQQWYFLEPFKDSSEWKELYSTGSITRTWSTFLTYLMERN